ncbi:hypothetical protein OKW40_001683 [Paraburkholderia sp. RAU6.4a]
MPRKHDGFFVKLFDNREHTRMRFRNANAKGVLK